MKRSFSCQWVTIPNTESKQMYFWHHQFLTGIQIYTTSSLCPKGSWEAVAFLHTRKPTTPFNMLGSFSSKSCSKLSTLPSSVRIQRWRTIDPRRKVSIVIYSKSWFIIKVGRMISNTKFNCQRRAVYLITINSRTLCIVWKVSLPRKTPQSSKNTPKYFISP